MFLLKSVFISIICVLILQTNAQSGPDPWNYESKSPASIEEYNIPPDIRMPPKTKSSSENKLGLGEWFFRRTLAIVLKGGNTKINEDGSVDVSLQMKYNPKQWETLDGALQSDSPLSEDMLRRSVGYVEESIYKPSITEQIVLTWTEYIQVYLTEYKTYITWTLCFLAVSGGVMWLWSHMSHKHAIVVLFLLFYAYEVVVSYKEAEQNELDKFISAVSKCKWYFWSSSCDIPPPDPVVFMKNMNPLKIGIRMFTTALAEPFIVISGTVETILHGITAGFWYPLDKILYGILIVIINTSLIFFIVISLFYWVINIPFSVHLFGMRVSVNGTRSALFLHILTLVFIIYLIYVERIAGLWYPLDKILFGILVVIINISLIFLLVMILFNWVLNISFGLSVFGVGVSIKNKKSTPFVQNLSEMQPRSRIEQAEGISQATLDKILNVCSLALSNNTRTAAQNETPALPSKCLNNKPKLRRSASTGRLPNNSSFEVETLALENTVRRRNICSFDGSGDA